MEYTAPSSWRGTLASLCIVLTGFTATAASARETHYTDVSAGAWYEDAAAALLLSGALDETESRLRPNDLATRAEVLKLLVNVYGETLVYPAQSSFRDVLRTAWYFPYVETAAQAGWMKGDRDCYGSAAANCTARPASNVNRAEMAILLQRAFNLVPLNLAPVFPDNRSGEWYYSAIQSAADHCILQGDGLTGLVRPGALMNRAEMIIMFHRASQQQRFGQDCAEPTADIQSVSTPSAQRVRITFNLDLDPTRMSQTSYYSIERVSGGRIDIDAVAVTNARILELELGQSMSAGVMYRLVISNMLTEGERLFSDSRTFTYSASGSGDAAQIDTVTVRSTDVLRVQFSDDMDRGSMDDIARYDLERTSGGGAIDIDNATVVDDRTVDLSLESSLASQSIYVLSVENIRTDADDVFSDSQTFNSSISGAPGIEAVHVRDSDLLRVSYSEDIDRSRADDAFRYSIQRTSGGGNSLSVDRVIIIDNQTVELELSGTLSSSINYRLSVDSMRSADGETFSDNATFNSNETGAATIDEVSVRDSDLLRVQFSADIDRAELDDTGRYSLERAAGGGAIDVDRAIIVNDRMVDLSIDGPLVANTTYVLRVEAMRTENGSVFSDSLIFSSSQTLSTINSITPLSATRLRLVFSNDLEEIRSEDESRYSIAGFRGTLAIAGVTLIGDDTVEIALDDPLQSGEEYVVTVSSLRTAEGATFSDDITVIVALNNVLFDAALSGQSEVPAVITNGVGTGTFTMTATGLQYDITISNVISSNITGAHFHRGDVGVSGPVLEPITFVNLRATGTWSALTAEERTNLLDGDVYVNVHTSAHPDGEIRGQLIRR